ncbi:late competence protein ComER [Alkalihalobacillus pseudalcaliphilus]|uniref:late competence protein ComER n=1 Tax=Alkalihalobacillus pseudalcaliphilus TaxID=79884 RepID=UPI00064D8E8D|nr:late competence protein ComER [Alkalihalobacillus pseudalcaliphilus]KMK75929.1 competence protein [Alkalihalobacillus pseudalcaliphilus]
MRIGVIGTGSMGTVLIEAWIDSKKMSPESINIYNRSSHKAERIQKQYPSIHLFSNPVNVVQNSEIIFICVKPHHFPDVIDAIAHKLENEQIVVSITSPITVEQLEEQLNCKVARVIPSILNRVSAGSSLVNIGRRCSESDKETIIELMSSISEPLFIDENITRVASDILCCGPAFFSYLLQEFINAAVRQTDISKEEATILASNMLIGMGQLIEKGHYSLDSLKERVCVPGGITGVGLQVLEDETGSMFDHLFQETHRKYYDEQEKLKIMFKT